MSMARLVQVLFLVLLLFREFGDDFIHVNILILGELAHDFLDAPFHHAEVLLGVDWFGLWLSRYILDFLDGAVFALLTVKTAVNTCGGLRRFIEHVSELDLEMVIGELFVHEGDVLGGVIEGEIVPAIGAEPGEVESEWVVQISHNI